MDLVEISPKAAPPVCKVIDYSKFRYDQKKKQKELKAKAQKVVMKEIRFGPNTDEHDFNFKLNHAKNFLESGAKLKAYVHFVGRTIVFKERGEQLLLKFALELEDYGKVEQLPKLEGKRMSIFLAPKVTKKPTKPKQDAQATTKDKKNKRNKNKEGQEDADKAAEADKDAKATKDAETTPKSESADKQPNPEKS
ncbi:translation initiation factor IF-3 [Microscilla marina ATCC 23134]|uniref:Translation initiation factor IF-3 n=1 Tax=Microscilla marina ATCC 23134 TaxID=313606 RepID=A1ZX87_MICM2|nr:translation initiation factor IF-3 [Microscilla marina ATCC 23134]